MIREKCRRGLEVKVEVEVRATSVVVVVVETSGDGGKMVVVARDGVDGRR